MQNKCFLLSIMIIGTFSNIPYAIVVPFLPFDLQKRSLSQSYSGVVFGVYSLAFIIVPFYLSLSLFDKLGRKCILIMGELMLGSSLILYGILHFIENPYIYLVFTILSRIFQGFGSSFVQTSCYAMLSIVYQKNLSKAVSFYYMGTSFGNAFGPIIGGLLYNLTGFAPTFFIVGGITTLNGLLSFSFPSKVDIKQESQQEAGENNQKSIKILDLLKIQRVVLAVCNVILTLSASTFFEPILSIKLKEVFHFQQYQIAFFFSGYTIAVATSGFIMLFIPQSYQKRKIIMCGNFLAALGLFLSGPSKLFGLPNYFELMLLGMIINGLGATPPHSLTMAEIVKGGKEKYSSQVARLSDLSSGLLSTLRGFVVFLSAVGAQLVYNNFGYQYACDTLAWVFLGFAIVYLVLTKRDIRERSNSSNLWEKRKGKRGRLEQLKEPLMSSFMQGNFGFYFVGWRKIKVAGFERDL